jgi:predicted phosphoadenosine phosphosulfate sulfurtransferase
LVNTFALPRILLVTPPNSIRILHLNYSVNYRITTNLIQSNKWMTTITNHIIYYYVLPSSLQLLY